MSDDWISRAESGRVAWEALSAGEREELLLEVRFEPVRCRACSDCTLPSGHGVPHNCDCRTRWQR